MLGNTVTFTGSIDSHTLDDRYQIYAFVKALDPNNSYVATVEQKAYLTAAGSFSIEVDLPAGDYVPSLGFVLEGRNANPATDWGNVQISNLSATYDSTSSIPYGNFTGGFNGTGVVSIIALT